MKRDNLKKTKIEKERWGKGKNPKVNEDKMLSAEKGLFYL